MCFIVPKGSKGWKLFTLSENLRPGRLCQGFSSFFLGLYCLHAPGEFLHVSTGNRVAGWQCRLMIWSRNGIGDWLQEGCRWCLGVLTSPSRHQHIRHPFPRSLQSSAASGCGTADGITHHALHFLHLLRVFSPVDFASYRTDKGGFPQIGVPHRGPHGTPKSSIHTVDGFPP